MLFMWVEEANGAKECIALYRYHKMPYNHETGVLNAFLLSDSNLKEIRKELEGKDLACWCPLDKPCHADLLLKWANEE